MVLEALQAKKKELGVSDAEFAEELGISASYWSMLQNGERQFALPVLRRIVRRFPDLESVCSLFLRAKLTDSDSSVTVSAEIVP